MKKLLFICNQNKNRSKTAEQAFKDKFETRSAGLYNQKPVTAAGIRWADVVIVMEEKQRAELGKRFPKEYLQKRIVSLDIPDTYAYGQTELIKLLQDRLRSLV
ncbi:MAG TPA: phosphotyrosine protein phosphatase [Candidatus Nanoarchaeia archaeon]|nr:phosphotyrosine protein phosphatase [Candidatus Nanoarchaeia archaeon]